ncbi:hypothetical protein PVAND_015434 [Polypedilum vanderplanki]|uniref:Uncharacterized protein n=1 Tax=Polypedilum vanderplanki TaxID=319348 RepID=A0A9J6BD18_POLVA|nr:hypothetical protein PVAND_015434 [Polypedilum vanderplanki]
MFQDTITMKVDMHIMVVMMIITSTIIIIQLTNMNMVCMIHILKITRANGNIRDGDVVKGEYTLDEADGTKRIVKYSSDKHNGFQAHVERIGHAHHDAPVHHHGHHY